VFVHLPPLYKRLAEFKSDYFLYCIDVCFVCVVIYPSGAFDGWLMCECRLCTFVFTPQTVIQFRLLMALLGFFCSCILKFYIQIITKSLIQNSNHWKHNRDASPKNCSCVIYQESLYSSLSRASGLLTYDAVLTGQQWPTLWRSLLIPCCIFRPVYSYFINYHMFWVENLADR